MTQSRPLTSAEIDDGWCLEEAPVASKAEAPTPPSSDDEPYLELTVIEIPASGLEQAVWEQLEGREITHRFDEVSPFFGMRPRAYGTMPPETFGN